MVPSFSLPINYFYYLGNINDGLQQFKPKNKFHVFSANIQNYIIVQLITKFLTAAVAQSVRAFALQAEGVRIPAATNLSR